MFSAVCVIDDDLFGEGQGSFNFPVSNRKGQNADTVILGTERISRSSDCDI